MGDAKAHFSEVVRRANADGPQVVTCRGVETAVVVSADGGRRQPPVAGSWPVATAIVHRPTLVTRNVPDFYGLGVVLLDPWND